MSKRFIWMLFCFIFNSCICLAEPLKDYQKPASVSEGVWAEVKPYLLPFSHPLKKKMDKLFTSFRVTESSASLKRAGFTNAKPAHFSNAIISENHHFKDYIFKFYHDHQEIEVEYKQWVDRASEAKALKQAVIKHGYEKYFVVPKKWIYLIPDNPMSNAPHPKHFILIAKKIDIVKGSLNRNKWQALPTPKLLKAVWTLVTEEGLVDSCVGHNLPFTVDDKLAFIDLEQHHKWPIPYHRLSRYLNPKMQEYWNGLIEKNNL